MEWQSIDQMWQSDVVLALVPNLGNLVRIAPRGRRGIPIQWSLPRPGTAGWMRTLRP